MRFLILAIFGFVMFYLSACGSENINDKFTQIKSEFYTNEALFMQIVNQIKKDGYPISYLNFNSVNLANTLEARKTSQQTIDWYRTQMVKLNVEVALKMSAQNEQVYFAMWSQGIVPAGEGIAIKFTPNNIYEQKYYKNRNKKGTMSCETLKENWYICKHS